MHRALIVAVALLGLALYALFGGGDDAPTGAATDDTSAGLEAVSETDEIADEEAAPTGDRVASRPLIEQPRHRLNEAADRGAGQTPEESADDPLFGDTLAAAEPDHRAERAGTRGADRTDTPERRGDAPASASSRGGAFASPNCPVSLNRLYLARGVQEREPIGVDTVFSSDDQRVYVFMDVNNARGPEQNMVIHWDHLGSDHTYEQRIVAGPYPRWRTWVYHTMRRPLSGNWYVRVTNERGCALGEMYFEATPYRGS